MIKTLEEVLEMTELHIDRPAVEEYIVRGWIRPLHESRGWHFEEIDIARLQLVCHLTQDIQINNEGMDVVLLLLDQLYGLRAHMRKFKEAVTKQSPEVQAEIRAILTQSGGTEEDY